jgi:hypothetical protein
VIDRLLFAAGLSIAKRRACDAMSRAFFSIAAYTVLLLAALVAAGFLTAAGFIYLLEAVSVTEACVITAGLYALIGIFGYVMLRLLRNRRRRFNPAPLVDASQPALATIQDERLPGGIISLGLLVAVGYIAGRSMRSKR